MEDGQESQDIRAARFAMLDVLSDARSVRLPLILVDMTADLNAALMLAQIIYWHLPDQSGNDTKLRVRKFDRETGREELWLAKTDQDWWNEVRLTAKQVQRARKILRDLRLVKVQLHRFNGRPTCHYRIDESMFEFLHQDAQNTLHYQTVQAKKKGESGRLRAEVQEWLGDAGVAKVVDGYLVVESNEGPDGTLKDKSNPA